MRIEELEAMEVADWGVVSALDLDSGHSLETP